MNELVWTKEPPTVEGWYWVGRQDERLDDPEDYGIELITSREIELGVILDLGHFSQLEFAGPLPQPKEPGE